MDEKMNLKTRHDHGFDFSHCPVTHQGGEILVEHRETCLLDDREL